ncbi:MAG TPA: hypothetical protein VG870_06330 [Chitinophagaceae bacterium]|nr:hypothetical protein [Chitinophagaceae bacterium]
MTESLLSLIISIIALLIALVTFFLRNRLASAPRTDGADSFSSRPLQLQAYERLALLAERIALPNMVSRLNQPGISALEMQRLLLETIKQEYEYNASQQIYVSAPTWEAVKSLKDQNMLIINQVAGTLPPDAQGIDLNRRLLEFVMNQSKGQLHTIVLEALSFEAKKLMK